MGIASASIGAVGSIAQGIMGASQASKAKKALANYQRQELTNSYEGIGVSTLGADLQREELARSSANSVQALQQSGVRGVVGGIGAVQKANVQQSRQIGADLDMQRNRLDQLVAQDETRIRQMQEEREKADLAGLGQQLAVGQQNLFGGIAGLGQSMGSAAGLFKGAGGATPQVQSVGSPASAGLTPLSLPTMGGFGN